MPPVAVDRVIDMLPQEQVTIGVGVDLRILRRVLVRDELREPMHPENPAEDRTDPVPTSRVAELDLLLGRMPEASLFAPSSVRVDIEQPVLVVDSPIPAFGKFR